MTHNPIIPFRRRYLHTYKTDKRPQTRKLISVEEMARLINSIMDPRARAIAMLLAKTGVRRGELIAMDIDDIDWNKYSITLKKKAKRSNRVVFFDEECAATLRRWLRLRERFGISEECRALFVNYNKLQEQKKNQQGQGVRRCRKAGNGYWNQQPEFRQTERQVQPARIQALVHNMAHTERNAEGLCQRTERRCEARRHRHLQPH